MKSTFLTLSCALALGALASAQSRFATSVVSFNQGSGSGNFDQSNILGGPRGEGISNGSLHVLTLGTGGDVTLAFDVTITDGPGADLIVSENPLVFSGGVFAEVVAVEVSTNGTDFARFPARYSGPQGPLGDFDVLPWGTYWNRPGGTPVIANVDTNNVDPFDPVVAGGDALDLADLADHPLVVNGAVDLAAIHFVRLVDDVAGTNTDERGITIWDSGGDSSADVDAVSVIQHAADQDPNGPTVDLWRDDQDLAHLLIEDPDGLSDLDFSTLQVSLNLTPVSISRLRDYFVAQSSSATSLHLVSPKPLTWTGFQAVLAVSVRDKAGSFSADQMSLNR